MSNPNAALALPPSVHAGESFTALLAVDDDDRDLSQVTLWMQQPGMSRPAIVAYNWTLPEETNYTDVRADVHAPESGPISFRGEVVDQEGNRTWSDWRQVEVIPRANGALPQPPTGIRLIDNSPPPAQTAQMPVGRSPTVALHPPDAVFSGEPFTINAYVEDLDGDLSHVTLRWQGHGPVDTYDLRGRVPGAGVRWDLVAPESGPLFFRYEVTDVSGNGVTGDWMRVNVVEAEAPSAEVINQWLTVDRVAIGGGIYRNYVKVLPGAPTMFAEAAAWANEFAADQGGASPQALYDLVADRIVRLTATAQAAGVEVGHLGTPAITGTQTQTIVAYQGTYPVYQRVQPDGRIVQWTQTPGGASAQMEVQHFGQYVAPAVDEIPDNVAQAINEAANSGLPPSAIDDQQVATNVPAVSTFDPVHRLAGWDAAGNEVYHLTNEVGNVVEWSVLTGHDSREMIPGSFHTLIGGEVTHVVSLTPPGGAAGGVVIPPAGVVKSGNSNMLLLAGGVGLLAWILSRNSRA